MTKDIEETTKYVTDSITSEFGYDAEVYFPENRYDVDYKSEFHELSEKLSAEIFEWAIEDRKQLVLIRAGVAHQGKNEWSDEAFYLTLNFGWLKDSEFEELLEHYKSNGTVHIKGFDPEKPFKDTFTVRHDMLEARKEYIRRKRQEKISSIL